MRTVRELVAQTLALTAPLSEATAAAQRLALLDKEMVLLPQLGNLAVLHTSFEESLRSLKYSMLHCTSAVSTARQAKIVQHTRSMPRFFHESARVLKDIADRVGLPDFKLLVVYCVGLINAICVQQRMAQKALEEVQAHLRAASLPHSSDPEIDQLLEFVLGAKNNPVVSESITSSVMPWRPRTWSPHYSVFISHAGEDKLTIAESVWEQLEAKKIRTFLDSPELRVGDHAPLRMETAMETADICVVILSPEYAAKKWTMKELECFLRRRNEADLMGDVRPLLIPVFYRLPLTECGQDSIFHKKDGNGRRVFFHHGFFDREAKQETSVEKVVDALKVLKCRTGIENRMGASNDASPEAQEKRAQLVAEIVKAVEEAYQRSQSTPFSSLFPS